MIPVLLGIISSVAALSENECVELGFEKGLSCVSCKELGEFGLEQLVTDCNNCCEKTDEEQTTRYKRGVLEVCSWKLGRYPHVAAFIDGKLKQMKNMEVKYKKGQAPVIKLYESDSSKSAESVGIENWNEDTLLQFLDEKLEPA